MQLTLLSGSANLPLASGIAQQLGISLAERAIVRFPDGELHVELRASVRGHDVYLIQPTSPPAEAHLFELFFLTDACRRAGAARITAVVPYFGYARQDRRATGREPVSARVVADLMATSGIARVVAVDLHSAPIEGLFRFSLEHLSAVSLLTDAARVSATVPDAAIVVSPDLGAAKLAERYARLLQLPVAIVHKQRLSGEAVTVRRVIGEVGGRTPVIVDDMISTGGTIEAAARALLGAGAQPPITVIATHGLLVPPAVERLTALPLRRLLVSDSVVLQKEERLPLEQVSIAPLLAEAIRRLHEDRSLADLLTHE